MPIYQPTIYPWNQNELKKNSLYIYAFSIYLIEWNLVVYSKRNLDAAVKL